MTDGLAAVNTTVVGSVTALMTTKPAIVKRLIATTTTASVIEHLQIFECFRGALGLVCTRLIARSTTERRVGGLLLSSHHSESLLISLINVVGSVLGLLEGLRRRARRLGRCILSLHDILVISGVNP